MADLKDIIQNIENIYGSNNSLNILKDFERVIDELDVYVFKNWFDGELIAGPKESRFWIECTFMWPAKHMPDPHGGSRLIDYGCNVQFAESVLSKVRKIESYNDIRPGTRKGKVDWEPVWLIKIAIPKKLINDINRGYRNLDKNKISDILDQDGVSTLTDDGSEQQVQDTTNATNIEQ
jgi:hypothetical protein